MATITIHTADSNQETAIRIFLDALQVEYQTNDQDDTAYLLSSSENIKHLQKSIAESKNGEVSNISLDEIWKP